jgi:xylulokinase
MDWLADQVLFPEDDVHPGRRPPPDALERLNALAVTAPPGSNGVVFTPWLNGERTPVDDPYVRGGWSNVSLTTTRADLVRSVFEGIALNVRWMKEAVERYLGRRLPGGFRELAFVGGGACSALWCQILADVLRCTINQIEEPELATARGAALIAAVGAGELRWEDVPALTRVQASYEPDPARAARYDRQYRTFTELYRRNRGLYAWHNGPAPRTRGRAPA